MTQSRSKKKLTSEQLIKVATELGTRKTLSQPIYERQQFVLLRSQGKSTKGALAELQEPFSRRTGRRLYADFQLHGVSALLDGRTVRNQKIAFTPQQEEIALRLHFSRPAAGRTAIYSAVVKECEAANLPVPSFYSFRQFIRALPAAKNSLRNLPVKKWEQKFQMVGKREELAEANEIWQLDSCRLKIWVRVRLGKRWMAEQVWITLALDQKSRSIPGYRLAFTRSAAITGAMLRFAILPKENPAWANRGKARVLVPDMGCEFTAKLITVGCALNDIEIRPTHPGDPNQKGCVERLFRTLDEGLLRLLPGHMKAIGKTKEAAQKRIDELLTIDQLDAEIEDWIVNTYHQRIHRGTDQKPADLWAARAQPRMPKSERELDCFLFRSDHTRVVSREGINFKVDGSGGLFWAEELAPHVGSKVQIRYAPPLQDRIYVYSAVTQLFIAEARLIDPRSQKHIGSVKKARRAFESTLVSEVRELQAEGRELDRLQAQKWEQAHALEQAPDETSVLDETSQLPSPVDNLLAEFTQLEAAPLNFGQAGGNDDENA